MVTLEVADNGCGLAPELSTKIFEPYFSTKENGTGLGLTIVSQIIEDHRGYIRALAQRSAGNQVHHRVARARRRATRWKCRKRCVHYEIDAGGRVEELSLQKTILVVDDEDDVRESVREVLTDEGYRVVDTADGTRVLEMIKAERPELVLLDIWMPQIDGIGLLKEIKSQEPEINVVMVSGHGNIHTAVTATKFGAFDFIEKPVSLDGLLATVQRALGESPGIRSAGKRRPREHARPRRRSQRVHGAQSPQRRANDQTKNLEKERGAFRSGTSFRC